MTPDPIRTPTSSPRHPTRWSSSRSRVLVVEDNPDSAAMLADLIEALGHEVRTAADGGAALRTLATFRPDVALVDLSLPDMSGVELAHQLRAGVSGEPLLIAAITGWGAPRDLEAMRAAGFDHYFVKPVSAASLATLLGGATRAGTATPESPLPMPGPARGHLVAAADVAAAAQDEQTFATAIRGLVTVVDEHLGFELVAVAELTQYDFELATVRWSNLRRRLA